MIDGPAQRDVLAFRAPPWLACEIEIGAATDAWARAGARDLRRAVFCDEQRLFAADDGDERDQEPATLALVAVAHAMGMPHAIVGTVRLHEAEPGVWSGSRLAVAADYRRTSGVGEALVRAAVSHARARGCVRFTACVQAPHAVLFERIGWRRAGARELRGRAHVDMVAELERFAPRAASGLGGTARAVRAA